MVMTLWRLQWKGEDPVLGVMMELEWEEDQALGAMMESGLEGDPALEAMMESRLQRGNAV